MRKRSYGLGLLEVAVGLTILAVLLAIGIPAYVRSRANHTLQTAVERLTADLKQGRTLAMSQPVASVAVLPAPVAPPPVCTSGPMIMKAPPSQFKPVVPSHPNNTTPSGSSAITEYSVMSVDGNGKADVVRGPYPIDPSITVTYQGAAASGSNGAGVMLGSSTIVYFAPATGASTPSTIVLANDAIQYCITISATGEVTSAQEPLGTKH